MPRASYRIIPVDESFYEVRVDEPNASQRTVTGFQSIAEAEHWIETQKRHEAGIGQAPQLKGSLTPVRAPWPRPEEADPKASRTPPIPPP